MIAQTYQSLIRTLLLCTSLCVFLSGCGGGISGTGEGPIIIGTDNNSGADSAPENSADSIDGVVFRSQFPVLSATDLSSAVTATTDTLDAEARLVADSTITLEVEQRLRAYTNVNAQVINDLNLLETTLAGELSQCSNDGVCESIPATVSVEAENSRVVFSEIEFRTGLNGYFDKQLSYTRGAGNTVRLQWNNDQISLYTDTGTHTTWSLEDNQRPALTFRQLNKSDGAFIQATMTATSDGQINIEADLIDWYVRMRVIGQTNVLYAASSNNDTLRRETITPENDSVLSETCAASNCTWQPEHNLSSRSFDGTETTVGDFSQSIIQASPDISSVQDTARFVIATAANGDYPLAESIVCGGISVQNFQRVFCWTPLPLLAEEIFFYEETITNGISTYRRLQP